MNRAVFTVFLAFALALTGVSVAQTHGAAAATGQIVICHGQGTAVIYVDAEGQPTAPPHLCPDCVLLLATEAEAPRAAASLSLSEAIHSTVAKTGPAGMCKGNLPPVRAPPVVA